MAERKTYGSFHKARLVTAATLALAGGLIAGCRESESPNVRVERLPTPPPTTQVISPETITATPEITQVPFTPTPTPVDIPDLPPDSKSGPGAEGTIKPKPTQEVPATPSATPVATEQPISEPTASATPETTPSSTPQSTSTPEATPPPTSTPKPSETPTVTPTPETPNSAEALSVSLEIQTKMSKRVEELINEARQTNHLDPLTPNQSLRNAALNYAIFLHNSAWVDYPNLTIEEATNTPIPNPHTRNGTPQSRAAAEGYPGSVSEVLGENVLRFGLPKDWQVDQYIEQYAEARVEGWLNSPPHREIILSDSWTEIGTGCILSVQYKRPFWPTPVPEYLCVTMVGKTQN